MPSPTAATAAASTVLPLRSRVPTIGEAILADNHGLVEQAASLHISVAMDGFSGRRIDKLCFRNF